jgi:hypothetical protein
MSQKRPTLASQILPVHAEMAQPIPIDGKNIKRFGDTHTLHLTELCMALGINTAALYTKKNCDDRLSSSVCVLMRLYSAFPELIPRMVSPPAISVIEKITAIDPSFKRGHLGPLLGLETNSSFRLANNSSKSSQTVKNLLYVIDKLISKDERNWFVIKDAVEIEAKARNIDPPEKVWGSGGWSRSMGEKPGKP